MAGDLDVQLCIVSQQNPRVIALQRLGAAGQMDELLDVEHAGTGDNATCC